MSVKEATVCLMWVLWIMAIFLDVEECNRITHWINRILLVLAVIATFGALCT